LFFFNTVFLCLCFYAFVFYCALLVILLLLLVNMGGQHDGVFLSFTFDVHMCVFHLANKLCFCCYSRDAQRL